MNFLIKLLLSFAGTILVCFIAGYVVVHLKQGGYNPFWKPKDYKPSEAENNWLVKLRNRMKGKGWDSRFVFVWGWVVGIGFTFLLQHYEKEYFFMIFGLIVAAITYAEIKDKYTGG